MRTILVAILFVAICNDFLPAADGDIDPKALEILRSVEAERMKIKLGRMGLELTYRRGDRSTTVPSEVVFDGSRRRFLTRAFGASSATTFDGTQVMQFDGASSTTIYDLAHPTADYLFDPRTIGITSHYHKEHSIQDCLGYVDAKSIKLISRDTKAPPICHVRVVDKYEQTLDFWIEDAKGFRVVRHGFRSTGGTTRHVSESTYDDAPLPVRVETKTFSRKDANPVAGRTLRMTAFDESIVADPTTFGLAGLNMPVGTPVADLRIHQRIGYWNGFGLQEDLPKKGP